MKRTFTQAISFLNQTVLRSLRDKGEQALVRRFVDAAVLALQAEYGYAYILTGREHFTLSYKTRNTPYEPQPPRKTGTVATAFRAGVPKFITDVSIVGSVRSDAKGRMKGVAVIPITYQDDRYGVLVICYTKAHTFTKEEKELARYVGNAVAQAMAARRLYAEVSEFQSTLDHTQDPMLVLAVGTYEVLYANKAVYRHLQISAKRLVGHPITEVPIRLSQAKLQSILDMASNGLQERLVVEAEFPYSDGTTVPIEISIELVQVAHVRDRLLVTVRNLTELKKAQSEVKRSAYYDRLTGLPNRAYLLEELPKIVERSKAEKRQFALCVVDVDKFQFINDLLGHESADELLAEIAKRLWNAADKRNTVVRTSSDEFAVVLDPIKSVQDVELVASEIQRAFQEPFVMQDQEVFISISCGIAIFPGDGQTMQTLMQNASSALRWVKESGGGSFRHYYGDMSGISPERLHFAQELRQALRKGNLQVLFDLAVQPAGKGAVFAFSSIYLKTKQAELLPLQSLLTLPESSSLALEVGYWHIREALRVVRQWQADSAAEVCVCVPVSRKQLLQPDFATTVAGMVAAADVPPSALLLEVEEGAVMQNLDELLGVLGQLEGMGVRLIVGGFGRGYISLPHVHRMPIEYVRLDAEFTQGLNMNAHSDAIVSALISFAHDLGIGVVASGITSKAQAWYLREKKCDVLCGSWVSAPLAPDEAARFLRDKSWMRKLS